MSLWRWNDVELEIDMEDYDFLQKYEKAFDSLGKREKELQKVGEQAVIVKEYCEMFYQLFDDIFGLKYIRGVAARQEPAGGKGGRDEPRQAVARLSPFLTVEEKLCGSR